MAESEGSSLPEITSAVPVVIAGTPRRYVCQDCGRSFAKPQGLGAHRSQKHGYRNPRRRSGPDSKGTEVQVARQRELVETGPMFATDAVAVAAPPPAHHDSSSYYLAAEQFLPVLSQEIRARRRVGFDDFELVEVFFMLFEDTQASK